MPEREEIVLEIDDQPAVDATNRANKGLEDFEKKGARAGKSASRSMQEFGSVTVQVMDKSRTVTERMLANLEKRAKFAGATAIEKLRMQQEDMLRRVSGDERAVDRVREAYRKLQEAQERVERRAPSLRDALTNPLKAAGGAAEGAMAQWGKFGVVVGITMQAVDRIFHAIANAIPSVVAWQQAVENASIRTGLTRHEFQLFSAAARESGVSAGIFESSMKSLSTVLSDFSASGEKGRRALRSLQVDTVDLHGKMRPMSAILLDLSDSLGRVNDATKRNVLIQDVLGRQGLEAIALFNGNLRKSVDELKRFGIGIEDDMMDKLSKARERIDRINTRWDDFILKIKAASLAVADFFAKESSLPPIQKMHDPLGIQGGFQPFEPFGPAVPTPAELAAHASRQRAKSIIAAFEQEQRGTVRGLQEEIVRLNQKRTETLSELQQGGFGEDAARQRIGSVRDTDRQIAAAEKQIQLIKGREEAIKKSHALEESLGAVGSAAWVARHAKHSREFQQEFAKHTDELIKELERRASIEGSIENDLQKQREAALNRAQEMHIHAIRQREDFELSRMGTVRDAEMRALEMTNANTVAEKLAVEARKAEIETDYLQKSQAMYADMLRRRAEDEIHEATKLLRNKADRDAVRFLMEADLQERLLKLGTDTADKIQAATEKAGVNSARIVADHQQRQFDSLKRSAEGIFDALLMRTQNFGQAVMNILRTALLTPLKEFASSYIARMLMGGMSPRSGTTSVAGMFGGLFGMGGMGMAGMLGPGGTGGFAGPVGRGSFSPMMFPTAGVFPGASGATRGGLGIPVAGMGPQAIALAGGGLMIGGLMRGGASGTAMTIGGGAALGSQLAIKGTQMGALAGAGMGLAAAGIQRGGLSGIGMGAAGGAMVGFRFGGPKGAAIGAIIGGGAAAIRSLFKSAEQKAREKIKAAYSVDISDKGILGQIVATAKQLGSLDVAIHSPQIRDLVELYSLATGQGARGLTRQMTPLYMQQSGGALSTWASSLSSLPSIRPAAMAPAAVSPSITQLDKEGTKEFWERVIRDGVVGDPRAVTEANLAGMATNYGRRDVAIASLHPGLVTS